MGVRTREIMDEPKFKRVVMTVKPASAEPGEYFQFDAPVGFQTAYNNSFHEFSGTTEFYTNPLLIAWSGGKFEEVGIKVTLAAWLSYTRPGITDGQSLVSWCEQFHNLALPPSYDSYKAEVVIVSIGPEGGGADSWFSQRGYIRNVRATWGFEGKTGYDVDTGHPMVVDLSFGFLPYFGEEFGVMGIERVPTTRISGGAGNVGQLASKGLSLAANGIAAGAQAVGRGISNMWNGHGSYGEASPTFRHGPRFQPQRSFRFNQSASPVVISSSGQKGRVKVVNDGKWKKIEETFEVEHNIGIPNL